MGDRAVSPVFEFDQLVEAVERGDDATTYAAAQRALAAGAVPTASTVTELIALVLWRASAGSERNRRTPAARPHLVSHLRSAADSGERWAAAWLALDDYLAWDAPDGHPVPSLTDEERFTALCRAAETGHRRARFALARRVRGRDDSEDAEAVLELLRRAYADGTPDRLPPAAARSESWRAPDNYPTTDDVLADIALEAALTAAEVAVPAEAELWFARACYVDEWESTDTGRTRSWARHEYARWCDEQARPEHAAALRQLLIDEAARESLTTSRWMRSEWKTYRNDWQFDRNRESARHHALRARLEEQAASTPLVRERLVTVLSDNYFLGDDEAPLVRDYLVTTPGGAGFRAQLRRRVLGEHHEEATPDVQDADADHAAVIAVLWWLLREFQSSWLELLGLPDEAEALRIELDADSCALSPYALDDDTAPQGWESVLARVEERRGARQIVSEQLLDGTDPFLRASGRGAPTDGRWSAALGLAGSAKHYAGSLREIPALRGTPLGMGMWLAGGKQPLTALEGLDFELSELLATVQAALARRDGPPAAIGTTTLSRSLEELQAEQRHVDVVRSHLREQRKAFEVFVSQLSRDEL